MIFLLHWYNTHSVCIVQEQAGKYLQCLLSHHGSHVLVAFLRIAVRLLNERPAVDPRWRPFLTVFGDHHQLSSQQNEALTPEGCATFQFITAATRESENSQAIILPKTRLVAKQKAVERLKELWSALLDVVVGGSDEGNRPDQFLSLVEIKRWMSDVDTGEETDRAHHQWRRTLAGESPDAGSKVLRFNESKDASSISSASQKLPRTFADDDENLVEGYAHLLLRAMDEDRVVEAMEDSPLDGVGQWAGAHVLAVLHAAEEMVEFTRGIQQRLAR